MEKSPAKTQEIPKVVEKEPTETQEDKPIDPQLADKLVTRYRRTYKKKRNKIDMDTQEIPENVFPEKIEEKRFIKTKVFKITPGCEDDDVDNEVLNKHFTDLLDEAFLYCRLKKEDGHLVVDEKIMTEKMEKSLLEEKHTFNEVEYSVVELEDPFMFWAQHGRHFERLLKGSKFFHFFNTLEFRSNAIIYEKGAKMDRKFFELGGIEFESLGKIRKFLSDMLVSYSVGCTVDPRLNEIVTKYKV